MRMARWRWPLPLAAMASALALSSAAGAAEAAMEGVFQARGIVKAVEPRTGAMTFACAEAGDFTLGSEVYRVRASEVSECLRPGDTVDFTMDSAEHVILGVKLLNYDQ